MGFLSICCPAKNTEQGGFNQIFKQVLSLYGTSLDYKTIKQNTFSNINSK